MSGIALPSAAALLDAALLLALCAALAVVTVKDLAERRIPDPANLGVALLGLGRAWLQGGAPLALDRLLDTAVIGILLVAFRALYRRLRGVTGLGLGDVKFLAAATLWTGLDGIALLLSAACLLALAGIGLARLAGRPVGRATRIPFGPFLAAGLVLALALELAGNGSADGAPWG